MWNGGQTPILFGRVVLKRRRDLIASEPSVPERASFELHQSGAPGTGRHYPGQEAHIDVVERRVRVLAEAVEVPMSGIAKAAGLYFIAVFGAGFLLGIARVLWLVPQIGARAAELIEMPLMLAIMIFAARWIVRRHAVPWQTRYRLAVGGIALALVLLAEFAVVLPLRGVSLEQYWSGLDRVSGSLYYALLGLYALLPLLVQRRRWYSGRASRWAGVALVAAVFGLGYAAYIRDLEHARQRVATGSRVAQPACGPVEYAEIGNGPAVLLVHGAGGGFDQLLGLAAELARGGFRVVSMSRFGYLRTPLPADASPQAQADAHACLLDELRIGRAAIIGVSAGAPSSMQFALRHAHRTSSLSLLVPLAYVPRAGTAPQPARVSRFMYERAVKSDLLYWLALRIAPDLVVRTMLGTPPQVVAQASIEEQQRIAQAMEHILPLSRRQAGLLNEAAIAQSLSAYPLERISAPTLVISLADDLYGTYESAAYTASRIPGSRLIGYAQGGHLWIGHHRQILAELGAFLSAPERRADDEEARAHQTMASSRGRPPAP